METIEPRNLVDWSGLPVDLLQEISKKLHDILDFVYFRAVCKKWRAATSISDLPPQLPWLLEHRDNLEGSKGETLRFYSIFSDKILTIHCPLARGKHLLGPTQGYLYAFNLSQHNLAHSLLNPFSNDEVTIEIRRHSDPYMVCMGSDPIGDYLTFNDYFSKMVGIYQPCTCEWNYVELPLHVSHVDGLACFKGKFYMNEPKTGNTVVVNIASGSSFVIPPPKTLDSSDQVYFVESTGNILRIVKHMDESSEYLNFHIYQLDVKAENDQWRWVKTNNIGNQTLFLDWCSSISITAIPSTGLRGNCVYYIERDLKPFDEVYKYNIEDGQTETVPCPFNNVRTWLFPNLLSSLPAGHY
ncbi:hypothetical protein LUZ61_009946 [Rhynchospora tenuis]|uniref:F-box domain-containing protein n=1 Tax=Rhynchospora tenuis TaxID=198213 RepID=A0AAD6EYT3_9POAL|nr:hypothetical protein LUZ61_009946 [Rhynchospora tenuis]